MALETPAAPTALPDEPDVPAVSLFPTAESEGAASARIPLGLPTPFVLDISDTAVPFSLAIADGISPFFFLYCIFTFLFYPSAEAESFADTATDTEAALPDEERTYQPG